MLVDVVRTSVAPNAAEKTDSSESEDAHRMRMIVFASAGAVVKSRCPGRCMTGVIGESRDGSTQVFVAGPAEGDAPMLSRLVGDRRTAGLGGELIIAGEAFPHVAELSEDLSHIDGSGAETTRRFTHRRAVRLRLRSAL